MADAQRPLDITWDDVRKSRPPRRRQLLVGAVVTSGLVLAFGMHTIWAPPPLPVPVLAVAVPAPAVLKVKPVRADDNLCGALSRWSSNTILSLGPETRAYCGRLFPSI